MPPPWSLKRAGLGEAYTWYRVLCAQVHTSVSSLILRHASRERMTGLDYCRPDDPSVVGTLLMIAVYLLVRAGGELHRFTDLTEAEVQAVGEEASGVWETGQAEGGRDLKSAPSCRLCGSVQNIAKNHLHRPLHGFRKQKAQPVRAGLSA